MTTHYLEVTFRDGKPFAAYLYLPRRAGDRSARTERREGGVIVDFAADGRPIGLEITSPAQGTLALLNRVLASLNQPPVSSRDLAPLAAA